MADQTRGYAIVCCSYSGNVRLCKYCFFFIGALSDTNSTGDGELAVY
jgi:hypothetical protein